MYVWVIKLKTVDIFSLKLLYTNTYLFAEMCQKETYLFKSEEP